jgi:hypothetical protein
MEMIGGPAGRGRVVSRRGAGGIATGGPEGESGARVGAALGIGSAKNFGEAEADGDGDGVGEGGFACGGNASTTVTPIKKIGAMRCRENFTALLMHHDATQCQINRMRTV